MRTNYVVFVLSICIVCFLLPYYAGTTEAEEGLCPQPYIKTIFPRAAKPGDQIRIRGRRFGTEKGEVVFSSGVKAVIVEWTIHKIWVIVPESATSGPVIVRVACGSESNREYFKVKQ